MALIDYMFKKLETDKNYRNLMRDKINSEIAPHPNWIKLLNDLDDGLTFEESRKKNCSNCDA